MGERSTTNNPAMFDYQKYHWIWVALFRRKDAEESTLDESSFPPQIGSLWGLWVVNIQQLLPTSPINCTYKKWHYGGKEPIRTIVIVNTWKNFWKFDGSFLDTENSLEVWHLQKHLLTPPKINIAPEKWWLEDEFSFWDGPFSGAMFIFRGVLLGYLHLHNLHVFKERFCFTKWKFHHCLLHRTPEDFFSLYLSRRPTWHIWNRSRSRVFCRGMDGG